MFLSHSSSSRPASSPRFRRFFYLFFGGRFGTGKTNILRLIADLSDGILLENVSVTALARIVRNGKVVCIDEFDVSRGRDVDEVRDALVRQGYKATAAPYTRWNVSTKDMEVVPIYGPKALAFRGAIEDALQSRGFLVPTATPKGEESYSLVLRNLFPELGAAASRSALWGMRAVVEFPPERVREIAESLEFREKVKAVVRELGANRDSELMTVALLTAEIAGVDVLKTLKAAAEQREASAADSGDEAIEELANVVADLTRAAPRALGDDGGSTSLKQTTVLRELNTRRRAAGKQTLGSQRMASCRREIGVKDGWLRNVHRASWWVLPQEFVEGLQRTITGSAATSVGHLTPPGPPSRHGGEGEPGDLGDPARRDFARPPLPSPSDPEDLFGGRPTRADFARGRIGTR
jgi:hypothetical protein